MNREKIIRTMEVIPSIGLIMGLTTKNDMLLIGSAILTTICVIIDFKMLRKRNRK